LSRNEGKRDFTRTPLFLPSVVENLPMGRIKKYVVGYSQRCAVMG